MSAFSLIDLLSLYREPSERQTPRMRRLLVDHLKVPGRPAAISIQLWRHTLMHTIDPRAIRAKVSGRRVHWVLHWRDHLPKEQHMTVIHGERADEEILNLGVLYLLNDLHEGARRLFRVLAATPKGREAVVAAHAEMLAKQSVDV